MVVQLSIDFLQFGHFIECKYIAVQKRPPKKASIANNFNCMTSSIAEITTVRIGPDICIK